MGISYNREQRRSGCWRARTQFGIAARFNLVQSLGAGDEHPIKPCTKLGLQEVRFHGLRHTHATMMLKANVHPKVVMERLGHSQIAVTLDTYSHVVPGMQEKAALAFDAMLKDSSLMPTSTVR